MKQQLLLAGLLLLTFASAHNMNRGMSNVEESPIVEFNFWTYVQDILRINVWLILTYLIWPLGLVFNVLCLPSVYYKLYYWMIGKAFKTSGYYTFDQFIA